MDLFGYWEFWLGFVSIVSFMLIPHLYTMVKLKDGFVWVPFNNEHYCAGDNRIYAAGVNEARLNFFKYYHPCSETVGNMAIDFTRASSYRLAAILGLGIKDDRYAYLVSFVLSTILQYLTLCFAFAIFFDITFVSVLASLCIIYYFKLVPSIISKDVKGSLINILYTVSRFTILDSVNDNFRYVIMSSAGNFVWLSLLVAQYYFQLPGDFLKVFCLIVFIVPLLFVYPIVSVYGLFIIVWVQFNKLYINWDWHEFSNMLVGAASIIIIFIFGFYKRIRDIFISSFDVLIQSHVINETYNYNFKSFLKYVIKDRIFLMSFSALMYLLVIGFPLGNLVIGVFFFTIVLRLFSYLIKKNGVVNRFFERGALHFISFGLVVTYIDILLRISGSFAPFLIYLLLTISVFLPLLGSIHAAKNNSISGAFQLPESEWNLYLFLKYKTLPRSTCLAFSYSNLQLLPVYTNANLAIRGAEWLENPLTELAKYFKALEYVKTDTKCFWDALAMFHQIVIPGYTNTAKEEDEYKYYHLFKTLIYYPYVSRIGDLLIYDESTKKWNVKFIEKVKHEITNSLDNFDETLDYIIIDKAFMLNYYLKVNFETVFENERFRVYRKILVIPN